MGGVALWLALLLACGGASDPPAAPSSPAGDDDIPAAADSDASADSDAADSDAAPPGDTAAPAVPADPGPAVPLTALDCFGGQWGPTPAVDYGWQGAVFGSHCEGTNHQDITGVERVVFAGDSISVGTPPAGAGDWFRNRVADWLSRRFGLRPPGTQWRLFNPVDGMSVDMFSGDFASCAKFGARTDDLLLDPHKQLETCIPEDQRDKVTLVIMTMGGNDIYALLEDAMAGVDAATLRANYQLAAQRMREAVEWLKAPGRFPNGVYVVFGNTYDFTDPWGAEDMARCEGAQLIGMDRPLRDPGVHEVLAEAQEEYLAIAADTQTDVFFLGEAFCGHGYAFDDPAGRCYRGPTDLWLDFTCMHPNAAGHQGITGLIKSVVTE